MRGQSMLGFLAHEAKRNPVIRDMVERAYELTDSDIDEAAVPAPWVKQALRLARANERTKRIVVQSIDGFVTDTLGRLGLWDRAAHFIPVSASSSIMVASDYPLFFPDVGGMWIDTVFCPLVPECAKSVTLQSAITKLEYKALLRERLRGP